MPGYFFNVTDGKDILDTIGTVLPDRAAVRGEAIAAGGEMLSELGETWNGERWQMNVTDESGRLVFKLEFSATAIPESAQ